MKSGSWLGKVLYSMLVMLGIALLVFFLLNSASVDPARLAAGQRSDKSTLDAMRKELGLDKPLASRLGMFLTDLLPAGRYTPEELQQASFSYITVYAGAAQSWVLKTPDLKRSFQSRKPVSEILGEAFAGTLVLAAAAMLLAAVLGILLGSLAALRQGTWIDHSVMAFSVAMVSLPSFFAGILIAWVFGYLLHHFTGLPMTGSLFDYTVERGEELRLDHLVLPALALGLRPLAVIVQLMRSSLLEVMSQDYIRTAKAKGLAPRMIWWKHALRNALNPVVTAISGWFASLLAGAFFIEYIFAWRGLGKVTVDALEKSDFPVVSGALLMVGALFLIMNLFIDLIYQWLDPRTGRS